MKKGLTEIVFILDRSGSMGGLESDTIGGFNAMLDKQRKEKGEAVVTTVLFDDRMELLHDRTNMKGIKPITQKEYFVRGCTALLDAVGKSIHKIGNAQKNTAEEEQAEKVLFVITTDGLENASREYTYEMLKEMIEHQKTKYGWEFLFLGANMDAAAEAGKFGIGGDRAVNFHSDGEGTRLNYTVVSEAVSEIRNKAAMSPDWKRKIDLDYESREKKE
jgi:uncharacterized protein YegL